MKKIRGDIKLKKLLLINLSILFLLIGCNNQSNSEVEESIQKETINNMKVQEKDIEEFGEQEDKTISEDRLSSNNRSGNINAGGKSVILDNWVYFSNLFDNNYLYKMKIDGTAAMKLTEHPVNNIHIIGDWIYYIQLEGEMFEPNHQSINKMKLDGSEARIVLNEPAGNLYAAEDQLVFIKDQFVHTLKLGEDKITALPYPAFSMSLSHGKLVYYNHDGYHLGDLHGNRGEWLMQIGYGDFILDEADLYYTKVEGSGLYRFSLDDRTETQIINDDVDYFNVDDGAVYFSSGQSEASRSIYKVDKYGNNKKDFQTIMYSINIFEKYIIGEFARQGHGAYILIDKETNEIQDIYPEE